jgi:purine-cytosine permease-like protein
MDSGIGSVIIFCFSVIGLTNIIVDPAAIFAPVRNAIEKTGIEWLSKLVSCYQCTGTWAGFLCGFLVFGPHPGTLFCCGMAGSFLATLSATYMNYLEARSILGVDENG